MVFLFNLIAVDSVYGRPIMEDQITIIFKIARLCILESCSFQVKANQQMEFHHQVHLSQYMVVELWILFWLLSHQQARNYGEHIKVEPLPTGLVVVQTILMAMFTLLVQLCQ